MANISPTIKVDISVTIGIQEDILLGVACSLEEVVAYKDLFQEFVTFSPSHTLKCPKSI
jgi:hypothetical protein